MAKSKKSKPDEITLDEEFLHVLEVFKSMSQEDVLLIATHYQMMLVQMTHSPIINVVYGKAVNQFFQELNSTDGAKVHQAMMKAGEAFHLAAEAKAEAMKRSGPNPEHN